MLTYDLQMSSRESVSVNGGTPIVGPNTLAVPGFIANAVINAGLGAAWTTASHWVGSSILSSAGHSGYAVRGAQFANPALIGLAAGPAYQWGKTALFAAMPSLTEQASSGTEKLARFVGQTVMSSGTVALVGVLVSLTAHHRGDAAYPGSAQGAALAVTGNVVIGAAVTAILAAIAAGAVICCSGTRSRQDIEMGNLSAR